MPQRRSHAVQSQELEDTGFAGRDAFTPLEQLELAPDWLRSAFHILAAAVVIGVLAAVADALFGVLATLEGQW